MEGDLHLATLSRLPEHVREVQGPLASAGAHRDLERQLPPLPDRPRRGVPRAPRHRRARAAGDQGPRGPAAADGPAVAGLRDRRGRAQPVERRRRSSAGSGIEDVAGRLRGHARLRATRSAAEARAIGAVCGGVRIWSLYVPNGRKVDDPHYVYKLDWLARLREAARDWLGEDTALVGDWNIAPHGRGRLRHGGVRQGLDPRDARRSARPSRPSSTTGTSTWCGRTRPARTSTPTGTTTGSASSATAACASTSSSARRRSPAG